MTATVKYIARIEYETAHLCQLGVAMQLSEFQTMLTEATDHYLSHLQLAFELSRPDGVQLWVCSFTLNASLFMPATRIGAGTASTAAAAAASASDTVKDNNTNQTALIPRFAPKPPMTSPGRWKKLLNAVSSGATIGVQYIKSVASKTVDGIIRDEVRTLLPEFQRVCATEDAAYDVGSPGALQTHLDRLRTGALHAPRTKRSRVSDDENDDDTRDNITIAASDAKRRKLANAAERASTEPQAT
jgi:hypothetical protein